MPIPIPIEYSPQIIKPGEITTVAIRYKALLGAEAFNVINSSGRNVISWSPLEQEEDWGKLQVMLKLPENFSDETADIALQFESGETQTVKLPVKAAKRELPRPRVINSIPTRLEKGQSGSLVLQVQNLPPSGEFFLSTDVPGIIFNFIEKIDEFLEFGYKVDAAVNKRNALITLLVNGDKANPIEIKLVQPAPEPLLPIKPRENPAPPPMPNINLANPEILIRAKTLEIEIPGQNLNGCIARIGAGGRILKSTVKTPKNMVVKLDIKKNAPDNITISIGRPQFNQWIEWKIPVKKSLPIIKRLQQKLTRHAS